MKTKITIHHLSRMENASPPKYVGEQLKFLAPFKPLTHYIDADPEIRNGSEREFRLVAVEEWDGNKRVLHWAVEL